MTEVWVLYEESGEYSDYSMGILGVYSSPEQAMAAVTWPLDDPGWRTAADGRSAHARAPDDPSRYDRLEWGITRYTLDGPVGPRCLS